MAYRLENNVEAIKIFLSKLNDSNIHELQAKGLKKFYDELINAGFGHHDAINIVSRQNPNLTTIAKVNI